MTSVETEEFDISPAHRSRTWGIVVSGCSRTGTAQVAGVTCAVTGVRDHGRGGWSCPWLLFTDRTAIVVAVAEPRFASSAFDRQGSVGARRQPASATKPAFAKVMQGRSLWNFLSPPEDPTISCQNDSWLIAEQCSSISESQPARWVRRDQLLFGGSRPIQATGNPWPR